VLDGQGDRLRLGVDAQFDEQVLGVERTVRYDSCLAWAMRRLDQPVASSSRTSRSREVRVRTRNSTLGSRTLGGSAGAIAWSPVTSLRMAAASCRLERSWFRSDASAQASRAAGSAWGRSGLAGLSRTPLPGRSENPLWQLQGSRGRIGDLGSGRWTAGYR
jgi:hypothetical protein